jgi:glycosyltransferase involved in cell wall biosynthesis
VEGQAALARRQVSVDVAIDARETTHMSVGMRQYVRELVARLPRVAGDIRFATFGGGDNFDWAEQIEMPLWIARMRPRLVHFPSPYAPLAVPSSYVVTIHDLIDLHYPAWAKPKARWYYRYAVRRIARGARRVITDDAATAADISRFYGLSSDRIAVVPLGVDVPPLEPIRRESAYAIYVGNHRPHKDLPTLVGAWSSVDPALEIDLLLTGDPEPELARARRARGRLVFLGQLSHSDVLRYIAGAAVLVHAALREGFGLPLLEAVRLGTPVVAAQSSVPQPLHGHVLTFPAGDRRSLARAIEAVLRGERRDAAQRAREATAALTWDRCAALTAEVYRRLLGRT